MVTDRDPQPRPPADQPPEVPDAELPEPEEPRGGEAACWARLVCPECGAMTTEGHRPGCAADSRRPPGQDA